MKTTFPLDENDFLTHQLFIASTSKYVQKIRKRNKIRTPFLLVLLGFALHLIISDWTAIVCSVIVAILWYFFFPKIEKNIYRKNYISFVREHYSKRFNQMMEVEFTDTIIHLKAKGYESMIDLEEIEIVYEIPNYILIGLHHGATIIMPRNKIEHFDEWVTYLKGLSAKLGVSYDQHPDWKWK